MKKSSMFSALALAVAVPLAGCSQEADQTEETAVEPASETLAEAIAGRGDLTIVSSVLSDTGLAETFEGPGSYTIFAPVDEAFSGVDGLTDTLGSDARLPVLVAILRDHIVPGELTVDALRAAAEANDGSARLATVGGGEITVRSDGNSLTITGADNRTVRLVGDAVLASNGAVMPVDGILAVPTAGS